ncbi:MAG: hypothetical protein N2246_06490, partial [Candidatus Sumerlaeia bacterium]|nr:hypothetical protein [Candidatus Sumerlaeia bacterium]
MGKTLAEKILEAHLIEGEVKPGNFVYVKLDLILANDITAPLAIKELEKFNLFYPPFPTERNAFIGGNVATNASGEYSFRFGPTRD